MMPRNLGVAPKYDTWSDKYDAWSHLRRMSKLVGTGFYIPPAWYQHFRMFPPSTHTFKEEVTLNPHNRDHATQDAATVTSEARARIREELSRQSRTLAASGKRYFNIFWLQKPLDEAERKYYYLRREGMHHDEAIRSVLREFFQKQSVRQRVNAIHAESVKQTGKFLTMREAMSLLQVLSDAQRMRLAPHQFVEIGESASERIYSDTVKQATLHHSVTTVDPTTAEKLSSILGASAQETATQTTAQEVVRVEDKPTDGLGRLKGTAAGSVGDSAWFSRVSGPDGSVEVHPEGAKK
jgi:hypothetical protein